MPRSWLSRKWNEVARGIDPAYSDLDPETLPRYQHYIDKCLEAVDVENFTKKTMGKPYDRAQEERDDTTLEQIIAGEAARVDGLAPAVIQVMLYQFLAADITTRVHDQKRWVERVMRRRKVDYFPDPRAILNTMFEAEE